MLFTSPPPHCVPQNYCLFFPKNPLWKLQPSVSTACCFALKESTANCRVLLLSLMTQPLDHCHCLQYSRVQVVSGSLQIICMIPWTFSSIPPPLKHGPHQISPSHIVGHLVITNNCIFSYFSMNEHYFIFNLKIWKKSTLLYQAIDFASPSKFHIQAITQPLFPAL